MDIHLTSPSPFSYLVGEHARAVVAIQELQREVNSLLAFRDHVLEALPHLQLREPSEAAPRPRHSSSAPASASGKSLSEGPSTVVDSGFSTDKASTSMGKSSSSSSGELSGGPRWACVDPEGIGVAPPPLGSAEDELWQLLEVIQKKGTRLRRELERAEQSEREYGHASDPPHPGPSLNRSNHSRGTHDLFLSGEAMPPSGPERWKGPNDWWPHSLPGAGPRLDYIPGLEAWGEMERLRQDRVYLMGRLSRAEAEASSTHQRLIDLHSQLLSLAGEKRRLEDAFRALRGNYDAQGHILQEGYRGVGDSHNSPGNSSNKISVPAFRGRGIPTSAVTVSVGGDNFQSNRRSSSSVRIGEELFLPRVLKVPIRDRSEAKQNGGIRPSRIPQGTIHHSPKGTECLSPSKSSGSTILQVHAKGNSSSRTVPLTASSPIVAPITGSDRIVIERERSANRVDGGLSMPASLLKGTRIKVRPDKQRISAILREKDVLSLQKQLLTTVMETEVLRRQIEIAGEEWAVKVTEWETQRQKSQENQLSLTKENLSLKEQLQVHSSIQRADASVMANPDTNSIGVGTDSNEDSDPTYSVHHGPNVKYDIVIYEESKINRNSDISRPAKAPSPAPRKAPPSVEKPPRRSRPLSGVTQTPSSSLVSRKDYSGSETSFGRDSLGRVAKIPLKPHTHSARTPPSIVTTPTTTPRSSPAPSMSIMRGNRLNQEPQVRPNSTVINNSSSRIITRKDSLKVAMGIHSGGVSLKGGPNSSSSIISNGKGISMGSNSSISGKGFFNGSSTQSVNSKGTSNGGSIPISSNSKGVPSGGPHKNSQWLYSNVNGDIRKMDLLTKLCSSETSLNCLEKATPSPVSSPRVYRMEMADILSNQDLTKSVVDDSYMDPAPPSDYNEFFDSISNCYQFETPIDDFLGQKIPLPSQVQYLPPASQLWTGLNTHHITPPTRIPQAVVGVQPWCRLMQNRPYVGLEERSTLRDSLETEYSNCEVGYPYPNDLPEFSRRQIRRKLPGVIRIKASERPSVLPLVKENPNPFIPPRGHPTSPGGDVGRQLCKDALDDVNFRVEQILSKIAANANL